MNTETNPLLRAPFDKPAFTITPAAENINHAEIYILLAKKAELETQLGQAEREFICAAKRLFRL